MQEKTYVFQDFTQCILFITGKIEVFNKDIISLKNSVQNGLLRKDVQHHCFADVIYRSYRVCQYARIQWGGYRRVSDWYYTNNLLASFESTVSK